MGSIEDGFSKRPSLTKICVKIYYEFIIMYRITIIVIWFRIIID